MKERVIETFESVIREAEKRITAGYSVHDEVVYVYGYMMGVCDIVSINIGQEITERYDEWHESIYDRFGIR